MSKVENKTDEIGLEVIKQVEKQFSELTNTVTGILKLVMLTNQKVEKHNKETEKLINNLNEQIEEIKKKIILSEENANRSGRPPLDDQKIKGIKELRQKGLSQRVVAERIGVGNGTVAKYSKDSLPESNKNEQIESDKEVVAEHRNSRETNIFARDPKLLEGI